MKFHKVKKMKNNNFFAPSKMSLVSSGWIAENYHTGEKSRKFYSQIAAMIYATLHGPEWTFREVKEPSALLTETNLAGVN